MEVSLSLSLSLFFTTEAGTAVANFYRPFTSVPGTRRASASKEIVRSYLSNCFRLD